MIIRIESSSLFVAHNLPICRCCLKYVPYLSQRYSLFVAEIFPICRTTLLICRQTMQQTTIIQHVTRPYKYHDTNDYTNDNLTL